MSGETIGIVFLVGVLILTAAFFTLAGFFYRSRTGSKWLLFLSLAFVCFAALSLFSVSILSKHMSFRLDAYLTALNKIFVGMAAVLFGIYLVKISD